MKLISVASARCTWLFDLSRVNPQGLAYGPVFGAIKERYNFAAAPNTPLDLDDKKALTFDQGQFPTADGRDIFVSFKLYTDGIVATTSSSTKDTEAFLEDLNLFIQSLGLSLPPEEELGKGFSSTLTVECSKPLLSLNPLLECVIKFLESRLTTMDGKPRSYQAAALNFWSEDLNKPFAPIAFKFERKIGQPFNSNQFYSEAPLQTHEHLELLDELEKLLTL